MKYVIFIVVYLVYFLLMKLWTRRYDEGDMNNIEEITYLFLLIFAYPLLIVELAFYKIKNKLS